MPKVHLRTSTPAVFSEMAGLAAVMAALVIPSGALSAAKEKPNVPPPAPPPAAPAALASKLKLELVTSDTNLAVALVAAPDDVTGRLFLVEKAGLIRILRGTKFDAAPFLDLRGKVALDPRVGGEQGLLGLAFHPKFALNGRFFINYTDLKGDTRVVEMRLDKSNPGRADPNFSRDLLFADQPYTNHNGGDLAFAPDGSLFVLLGDGGSAADPQGNGQNPKTLLGKAIRLDVEATAPVPEVIGRGLRNPWRFSFDRKTGDLYIADVGQSIFEYVHVVPAGKLTGHNFGWNVVEGLHCFQRESCDTAGMTRAVIEYAHSEGCSITGGYVYRGKALPELAGVYFFSDYCTAILRSFRMKDGRVADSWDWKQALDPDGKLAKVVAFGQDGPGDLYVVTHEGPIWKLVRK